MIKILSIREQVKGKPQEFIRGSVGTIKRKIINKITQDPNFDFDFLIEENGKKLIKSSQKLKESNDILQIVDDKDFAAFFEGEDIIVFDSKVYESLPQQRTVDQLKKIRKLMKGIDIADKISNLSGEGANLSWDRNPVDTGIESFQDFEKKNKKFNTSWNLKHLEPFSK
jgi:hypothetical protein